MTTIDAALEWLEADGLGGFASGTAVGIRTRKYHALLLTATTPPTGRVALVNAFDAYLITPGGRWALSTQRYLPDVLHPDGVDRIAAFRSEPWPTWELETPDGYRVRQEIVVEHGGGATLVEWTVVDGPGDVALEVRPFFSGRDYHATHHENGAFAFTPEMHGQTRVWRPYPGLPGIAVDADADYAHAPQWYRNFLYAAERERGLDDREDLASPGTFTWTMRAGSEAVMLLRAVADGAPSGESNALERARLLRAAERARRSAFATPIDRAADAYLVRRGQGRTLVAGYPWFTDWGRDTFIAIRGLCIAAGRVREARDVLLEWSGAVSEGMLPNRFPDAGESPEFNSVDASLWFVVAVHDLLAQPAGRPAIVSDDDRQRLQRAVREIVEGYSAGTRYGIHADADGLLAAGVPGVPLTWMDARVGDRVITPRIGKPVEIQALWINALQIAAALDDRWTAAVATARRSFAQRFWNADRSCLYDVVDVDHVAGSVDPAIRPNQILAVGGLPYPVIAGAHARRVVDVVERELATPVGLRSLAPSEPGYAPHYQGGPAARDAAYHQGTVWPWLLGPFVEAWVRVRRSTPAARRRAERRFVAPVLEHIRTRGLGHLSEIADAVAPCTLRGCPFQAWSLGEVLRISASLRAADAASNAVSASLNIRRRARRGNSTASAHPARPTR